MATSADKTTKRLAAQAEAVEAIKAATDTRAANQAERDKQAEADDKAVTAAIIAAHKAGIGRGELAELVGVGRTTFAKLYSATLDAKVNRPRTGAKR